MVAYDQLIAVGLTDGDVRYRLRVGRLHVLHRGVYAVGHRALTWRGRWRAATLAVKGSRLSHITAVMAFRMLRPEEGEIHVSLPAKRESREGIRVHCCRNAPAQMLDGIPISPPAVAIRELCSMRAVPDRWCSRAMNQALVDDLVTIDDLFEEAYSKRAGARRMKGLIWAAAPARSGLEDATIAKLRRAKVPPFEANFRLHGFEVDLYLPERNLVVELLGDRYHRNPFAAAYDRWKKNDLERRGVKVLLVGEADDVLAAIYAA